MKFYLSSRKPAPETEIMDAQVGVAMDDWGDIPTHEIATSCTEARKQSDGFLPPNSLVVNVWTQERNRRDRIERERQLRIKSSPIPDKTPEEKAAIDAFFKGLKL
jgi:hypothetical protein